MGRFGWLLAVVCSGCFMDPSTGPLRPDASSVAPRDDAGVVDGATPDGGGPCGCAPGSTRAKERRSVCCTIATGACPAGWSSATLTDCDGKPFAACVDDYASSCTL